MTSVMRRGDPQRQDYWRELVRRWKESGRSVREFCRAEGLRESAFFFWRRRLGGCSGSAGTASKRRHKASRLASARQSPAGLSLLRRNTPSFLPVRVTASAGDRPAAAGALPAVEIILARGRTVRVRAGFDRQTLADVLAVLEAPSC